MKKIVFLLMGIFILTGCGCTLIGVDSPSMKVDKFLQKYQNKDEAIITQLQTIMDQDSDLIDDQRDKYQNYMEKQYKDMTYIIKDETINGDNATVGVEIKVYNYSKSIKNAEDYIASNASKFTDANGETDTVKVNDYKLEKMDAEDERVTYTLNLTLTKENNEWKVDDLTETQRQKIHGIYAEQ